MHPHTTSYKTSSLEPTSTAHVEGKTILKGIGYDGVGWINLG
jgi:hypothetical protein